ncbi:DHS-like NAD/FAD-binding domain-containing protein [Syncephalis pseudoplumigaleata]|uniref:deoxyhypusine synthase n=1 Tax=Syncephalis pseudoplumigaleata TaxID=1712513 RepID=A0A4P9Z6V1_9FUNG|nr:DHS-like NAD/FAD-binding domain-containing protein [Syncephalis pseudoplumigaleata]|eukprot:RKP28188.1 DHS-like NAD/FAD-binding domain-containing protein [Syncephalis pseudoplumigaleata]
MTPPPNNSTGQESEAVTSCPSLSNHPLGSAPEWPFLKTPLDHVTPLNKDEEERADRALAVKSQAIPFETKPVRGYDFNEGIQWDKLVDSFGTTGFQASALGRAIDEVNRMLRWRLSDDPIDMSRSDEIVDPEMRRNTRCTIFLGYTSNMASCGVREIIRYLVQHRMVDCIVTTAGGIEEDIIKCLGHTYLGEYSLQGGMLRGRGLNRIGNLLLPNDNYVKFSDWLMPVLDQMLAEQDAGTHWTPSKYIDRLGKEINHPDSIYYWCHKNAIPVFCPAVTDGALGENFHMHALMRGRSIIMDAVPDSCAIDRISVRARKSGIIIIGGGVAKHHICNANLKRGGADYAVYLNTGQEFDGSDAGARPDEAVSWGKIKSVAQPIKVYCEASIAFPILVARTFARVHQEWLAAAKKDGTAKAINA